MSEGPEIRDLPVGIGETGHRRESDSMGVIHVPADRYWGAQTQRSLLHFGDVGDDPLPPARTPSGRREAAVKPESRPVLEGLPRRPRRLERAGK